MAVYFLASLFAIACSLILKQIKDETTKKAFSILTGTVTQFYVFGISAMASLTQNLICFMLMKVLPAKSQHKAVFVMSALILALA